MIGACGLVYDKSINGDQNVAATKTDEGETTTANREEVKTNTTTKTYELGTNSAVKANQIETIAEAETDEVETTSKMDQIGTTVGKTYEIGYWLKQSFEKQGYVNEACKRLMEYGIKHLNAERFTIDSNKNNKSSCRVAEKLGFRVFCESEIELSDRPEWGKLLLVTYERTPPFEKRSAEKV